MKNGTNTKDGHTPTPALTVPQHITAVRFIPRERQLALMELDAWDDEISRLNQALRDQTAARELLADASRRVELARERCKLLRAAVATQLAAGSEV